MNLDFTNLLAQAGMLPTAPPRAPAPAPPSSTTVSSSGASSTAVTSTTGSSPPSFFINPNLFAQANQASVAPPVAWPGMTLDELRQNNPSIKTMLTLLFSPTHENCYKEWNFHEPTLIAKFEELGKDVERCTAWYNEAMIKGQIRHISAKSNMEAKEVEMERRLRADPMDEEGNAYFGEKIRKKNVEEQYELMMEQYPESMGKILMLYIEAEVSGIKFPGFVDSGAQMTIMSEEFAEKLGLLRLVDTRFAGTAVGVGTSKILGKVHCAQIKIAGSVFPMSVTIMEGGGLGDKNMDFLLGLDMLKRHRCSINLAANQLEFLVADGKMLATPFLQEYQLDKNKGGTKGFSAEASNAELESRMKEIEDSEMKEAAEKSLEGAKTEEAEEDAKMDDGDEKPAGA